MGSKDVVVSFLFGNVKKDTAVLNVDYAAKESCTLEGLDSRVISFNDTCCFSTVKKSQDSAKTFTVVPSGARSLGASVTMASDPVTLTILKDAPTASPTAEPAAPVVIEPKAFFCYAGNEEKTECTGKTDKFAATGTQVQVGEGETLHFVVYRTVTTSKESFLCFPQAVEGAAGPEDYDTKPTTAVFAAGEAFATCQVAITNDDIIEFSEKFVVVLKDSRLATQDGVGEANVIIKDSYAGSAVWPAPVEVEGSSSGVIQAGKNAKCVSVCDETHSSYGDGLCGDLENDEKYVWEFRRNDGPWVIIGPSRTIAGYPSNKQELSQGYLKPGVEVRCSVAPKRKNSASKGAALPGTPAKVSESSGTCNTQTYESMSSERFEVTLDNKGSGDDFMITVTVPATDGMQPEISTKALTSLGRVLPENSIAAGTHTCTNFGSGKGFEGTSMPIRVSTRTPPSTASPIWSAS